MDWDQRLTMDIDQTDLRAELTTRFGHFEQVNSIYLLELPQITEVFIFLSQEEYSDELMDCLLDEEVAILNCCPDRLFNFHYSPLIRGASVRPVPHTADLLFGSSILTLSVKTSVGR